MLALLVCSVLCGSDNPLSQADIGRTDECPHHHLWVPRFERSSNGWTPVWRGQTHDKRIIVYLSHSRYRGWQWQVVTTDGRATYVHSRNMVEEDALILLEMPPDLAYLQMLQEEEY